MNLTGKGNILIILFTGTIMMLPQIIKEPLFRERPANLHYLIRPAKNNTKPAPAVILLHGIGGNEQGLFKIKEQIPEKFTVISVRSPLKLGPDSYGWYRTDFSVPGKPVYNPAHVKEAGNLLFRFLEQIIKTHNLDPDRIYLGGFSQGGIMSYHLGLRFPEKFKGIIIMGSRLLKETQEEVKTDGSARDLRVFIAHGTIDQVLPITFAREAKAVVESMGISPLYIEREEAGHWIDGNVLQELERWLMAE